MDNRQFDYLTRRLAESGSRRGFVAGLAAIAAGLVSIERGEARRRRACPAGEVHRPGRGCVCRSTGRPPGSAGCGGGGDEDDEPTCLGEAEVCTTDAQCCTGNCDSYSDTCRAVPFGCDPDTDPCPSNAICCPNTDSPSGFVCKYDPRSNQKSCGTTCENIVNCLNFNPDRICVDGICVEQP